ncbi:CBS domain-containing protein [Jejuia pallidilutea]|uniref:CBS domain-containing protein n=1 Tax=Jejuia pallidilutea TaxID=504487 RepID=UPI001EE6B11F|nr:CBS domain-containing protein [Jejuia pallidilutea]
MNKKALYTVGSVMITNVISIEDQTKIPEAKALMEANNIRFLPITKQKKLIGLITSNDL